MKASNQLTVYKFVLWFLQCTFVCFWNYSPPSPQWAMASSFTRFLDLTQRHNTVGRTPLDEWSARRKDLYLTTHNIHNKHSCLRWDSNPQSQEASGQWDRLSIYYKCKLPWNYGYTRTRRAGRSVVQTPFGTRFFVPAHTSLRAHPHSRTIDTASVCLSLLPGVKRPECGRIWVWVEPYTYILFIRSWQVTGWPEVK